MPQSRVKKIKCVQQPLTGKCEACVSSNVPCHYRDREQYFAERTRLLSGDSGVLRDASANAHNVAHLSTIDAHTLSSSRGSSPSYSSRSRSSNAPDTPSSSYSSPFPHNVDISNLGSDPFLTFAAGFNIQQSLLTSCVHVPLRSLRLVLIEACRDGFSMQPLSWSPLPSSASHTPNLSGSDLVAPRRDQATRTSPFLGLFDEIDHQQPHPHLMMAFLHVFFQKLGPTFPFLLLESVYERFLHRRLSPLLANAIAASASP